MPTKYGRVTSFGRKGPKFTEAFLESGERVELSPAAMADLLTHDPSHALVFVERRGRLFHYVQWIGLPDEAVRAVKEGVLRPGEVPPGVWMVGEALQRVKDGTSTIELTAFDDLPPPETEVTRFLRYLETATPQEWVLMGRAHAASFGRDPDSKSRGLLTIELGGQRGIAQGWISGNDAEAAKEAAEAAADKTLPAVAAYMSSRQAEPGEDVESRLRPLLRSAANAIVTLILIRPFLTEIEAEELWEPYQSLMPEIPRET